MFTRCAPRALPAAALLAGAAATAGDPGDALGGRWRPQDDAAAVISVTCRQGVCDGTLAAHREHPERASTHVLQALRWDAAAQRWRGKVYAARLDRTLDAEAIADGNGRFVLEVSTWLGSKRVVWERVADE